MLFSHLLNLLVLFILIKVSISRNRNRLLLISLDGFRWDYLSRNNMPNLLEFRKNGAAAEYLTSTFVTKTFPSHTTIVTGKQGLLKIYNVRIRMKEQRSLKLIIVYLRISDVVWKYHVCHFR